MEARPPTTRNADILARTSAPGGMLVRRSHRRRADRSDRAPIARGEPRAEEGSVSSWAKRRAAEAQQHREQDEAAEDQKEHPGPRAGSPVRPPRTDAGRRPAQRIRRGCPDGNRARSRTATMAEVVTAENEQRTGNEARVDDREDRAETMPKPTPIDPWGDCREDDDEKCNGENGPVDDEKGRKQVGSSQKSASFRARVR